MTFVLGLTGSIGMGKSATAALFRAAGVGVHDADEAVHRLYRGAAAPLVEAAFPGTTLAGIVDRERLGAAVLGDAAALGRLERLIHPLVQQAERAFLAIAVARQASVVVLDIPLLFETAGQARCDAVVVVTAPAGMQRTRVFSRPGMTAEKFAAIRARQMPEADKRAGAHFLVDTSRGFDAASRQVRDILKAVAGRSGTAARAALMEAEA